MLELKVMDVVAVSRESFSAGIRKVAEDALERLGDRLESVEIEPPWNVVLTKDGSVEFRNTVRLIYRAES